MESSRYAEESYHLEYGLFNALVHIAQVSGCSVCDSGCI